MKKKQLIGIIVTGAVIIAVGVTGVLSNVAGNYFMSKTTESKDGFFNEIMSDTTNASSSMLSNLSKLQSKLGIIADMIDGDDGEIIIDAVDNIDDLVAKLREVLNTAIKYNEKAIEDKVMAKINKANRTAGSLISGKVDTATPSISSMSSKDFEALKERVKRGERITL